MIGPSWNKLPFVSLEYAETGSPLQLPVSPFLCETGKDLYLKDSYLRSATTSKASLDGVERTVPGVDSEDPLFPAVDTKPASSGDEEPREEMYIYCHRMVLCYITCYLRGTRKQFLHENTSFLVLLRGDREFSR